MNNQLNKQTNDQFQDYVLLRADSLRLMVLRSQVLSIAHIQDRRQADNLLITDQDDLRDRIDIPSQGFVSLSQTLDIMPQIPKNRFVQTTWKLVPHIVWCWSEVRLMNHIDLQETPIALCLKTSHMPVSGITMLSDEQHAFTCHTDALLAYVLAKTTEEGKS